MAETNPQNDVDPFSTNISITQNDTVFYSIYPDASLSSTPPSLSTLHSLHLEIISFLSPLTSNYIWQHQPFTLSYAENPIPHLRGKVRIGDNIDDEWFIVYLLFQVSREFKSVSIRVWDSDGEFLLMEAAYHIPKWINPENAGNRVFIRNNEVHIIGRKECEKTPSLEEALRVVMKCPEKTRAAEGVQKVIAGRIGEYPERAKRNVHRVRVRVPIGIAQVLILLLATFLIFMLYETLFSLLIS